MKRLLLLLLVCAPAWGQYAPLSLSLTDPPNISASTIVNPGNQALWDLTTLTSASSFTSYVANSIQVIDNGANNSGSYGRVIEVDMTINGGSVLLGPRANTLFKTVVNAPTANVLPTATSYGNLNATITCNGNDNGTGLTTTTAHGNCSGLNIITILGATATNWYGVGAEFDSVMNFGSTAVEHRGIQIAHTSPSKAIGAQEDFALGIGGQAPEDVFTNVTISDTVGDFACTCSNVQVGDSIKISGTNSGTGMVSGYVNPTTYYVVSTDHLSTFQLGDITTHVPITTTAGTTTGWAFNDTWDTWGWLTGLAIPCGPPCTPDINRLGTIIGAEQPWSVAHIIDFSQITCTVDALKLGANFLVDCSGNMTGVGNIVADNGSANMRLGNGTGTGTISIGNPNNKTNFPGQVQLTTGNNLSQPAWTNTGLVLSGGANKTLTDTTSTGAVNRVTAAALASYNVAMTQAGVTVTNLDTLYVNAPTCDASLTCTNLWSVDTAGGIRSAGLVQGTAGANFTGAITQINASSSFVTNIGTGSTSSNVNIGGGSNTVLIGSNTNINGVVNINVGNNATTNIGTGSTTSQVTIGGNANTLGIHATVNINNNAADTGIITIGNSTTTGVTKLAGLSTGTNADFLCLSAGNVVLIQASACTISSQRYKDLLGPWPGDAGVALGKLQVYRFMLKPELWAEDPNSRTIQAGITAEDVASALPDCAIYDPDMKTPKSYRQECLIAILVKAQQENSRRFMLHSIDLAVLTGLCLLLTVFTWRRHRL
jgi:hypothetical protein